ncbi:MAG: hypothetical protein IKI76_09425 [Selenomonadaceae bacterium]|nr:hypothetical protein [Selenomonadaceae bacterium]
MSAKDFTGGFACLTTTSVISSASATNRAIDLVSASLQEKVAADRTRDGLRCGLFFPQKAVITFTG